MKILIECLYCDFRDNQEKLLRHLKNDHKIEDQDLPEPQQPEQSDEDKLYVEILETGYLKEYLDKNLIDTTVGSEMFDNLLWEDSKEGDKSSYINVDINVDFFSNYSPVSHSRYFTELS